MKRRGKTKKPKEWRIFYGHKTGAKRRGINFHFSLEKWCEWWKCHLGDDWLSKRGTGNKYVMARHGDKGPYALWNVKCITHSANSREQTKKVRRAKLTEEQVKIIYQNVYQRDKGNSKAALAKRFHVSIYTIKSIRKKETWRSVTDLLD